jgi:hypothetical protein
MSVISVKVNGKKVDLYDSDSNETFLARVASLFQLHPNFLEDINIDNLKEGSKIVIDNLINEIQEYKYDTNNINNNIDFIKEISEKYSKNNSDTIYKIFLSFHPFFDREITDEFSLLELVPLDEEMKISDIKTTIKDSADFLTKDKITSKSLKEEFLKDIRQRINISSQQSLSLLKINKEYTDMKLIDLSNIEIKKDESELKLLTNIKKSDYSLTSIFSHIICNEQSPFLTYNNLYKVYQNLDIKIPDDWVNSFTDFILLKIEIDDNKYTDCFILFDNELLTINIDLKYNEFTYFSEEYIKNLLKERIRQCFSYFSDFFITSEKEINISETILIPNQEFNTYVLSDILMNNNIFSKFLAVNESVQATKKKSGVYVHYFLKNKKGTCNITTVEDSESFFVRLRIKKAQNLEIIEDFMKLISKLLYYYKKNKENIIEFYKEYIPNFPKEKIKREVLEQVKYNLQKQVPDLFISGYPYKCQYAPIIVSDEEAKEYPEERVMSYPIKGEGKSYNYVCNDEKNGYIYVGLRENTLKNRTKYKYIPCCFKSDQTKRRGPYQEYFKGEIVEKGPQQNIIITNKLVKNEEYGMLPKNIDKFLSTFDESITYLRKGVNDTNLSFLDCVLESILDIADYSGLPSKSKIDILNKEYNKLLNYKYISVSSQENPNKTEDEIKVLFSLQKDTYLDPTNWIKLLESFYKCKIILFTRNKGERDGIITLPNHELIYLQEKIKDQKLVLIYEHYGTDLTFTYPRCELIIKWNSELTIEEGSSNYFRGENAKNIFGFYSSIIQQYYYEIFKKELHNLSLFDLLELTSLKPTHQIIDNYGKARGVIVEDLLLLSDPFPPIKALRYNTNNTYDIYKNNDIKKVLDFANRNNIKILSQIISDGNISEINMSISNIIFTAKVNNSDEYKDIENVDIDIIEKYPQKNTDLMRNSFLKRLAFILSEYFNYFYSYYLFSENKLPDLESIKSFIKEKVKIVESYKSYKIPSDPSISIDIISNNNFINNNKFLVENKEVLKRLIYSLRTQLFNSKNNIVNYYKSKEVYDFYKETSHFSENPDNIIVKNIEDLEKVDNKIYEKLQTEKNKFFMENSLINKTPIMLIKSDSKEDAFLISSNWVKNGRIDNFENVEPLDNRITYLYKSMNNIKVKKDIIFKSREDSCSLKYKKDKEVNYLALLKL